MFTAESISTSPELYFSRVATGVSWAALYVDAVNMPVTWSSLPVARWAHVHVQAAAPFHSAITVFARKTPQPGINNFLVGSLASLYLWGRPLFLSEVRSSSLYPAHNRVL